jgi:hypothetical protein
VSTTLEETVAAEQAEHDEEAAADDAAHEEPTDPEGKALFDRTKYQNPGLRIDEVDGQEVDKIWLKFSGRVALDRTKADDVALFNKARLGAELELRVSGTGARVGTGYTTSKGGDLEAVVGVREIRIDTVYVLSAEEL